MRSSFSFALFFFLLCCTGIAQRSATLSSPGGIVSLVLQQDADGRMTYGLYRMGKTVITPSALGMHLKQPAVRLDQFNWEASDSTVHDTSWQPVWGEVRTIRDHYRQLQVTLTDRNGSGIRMQIVFRLFDDGLGFRYVFPKQSGLNHFVIADERTRFGLSGDHKTFWIPGDYD
ncbi:MAG: hypothetical protein RJA57_425, partial [Bacteroidota bacterium]